MRKGGAAFSFANTDSDPLLELIVTLYPSWEKKRYEDGFPWRTVYDHYKWNGSNFIFARHIYSSPAFRFQAVNDGDWAFLYGDYINAISHYRLAISDDSLLWYTEERRMYSLIHDIPWAFRDVTPIPATYDPNEYPNLAAYSYFRMMLADIKLGRLSFAQTTYDWLQINFPTGKPGHAYAELAGEFWDVYKISQNFAMACSVVNDYAKLYPEEIFRYLSNSAIIDGIKINWPNAINFGEQSSELRYSPELICPP